MHIIEYERNEFLIVVEEMEVKSEYMGGLTNRMEVKAEYMGGLTNRILRGRSLWRLMMYSRNT